MEKGGVWKMDGVLMKKSTVDRDEEGEGGLSSSTTTYFPS